MIISAFTLLFTFLPAANATSLVSANSTSLVSANATSHASANPKTNEKTNEKAKAFTHKKSEIRTVSSALQKKCVRTTAYLFFPANPQKPSRITIRPKSNQEETLDLVTHPKLDIQKLLSFSGLIFDVTVLLTADGESMKSKGPIQLIEIHELAKNTLPGGAPYLWQELGIGECMKKLRDTSVY